MPQVALNFFRITFLILMITPSFAQINFEKGYIVNLEGERIECLIRNDDVKNNPKEIVYKMDESGDVLLASPLTIKKFEILGGLKYISAKVKIDTSGVLLESLSQTRYPLWKEETVFLKEILRGTASLYSFTTPGYTRFFFNVKNGAITQLVYKEYQPDESHTFLTNNDYMQQLWNDVKCSDTRMDQVKSLRYYQSDLKSYFIKFNKCSGDVGVNSDTLNTTRERDFLNLKLAVGMNFAKARISNSVFSAENAELKSNASFRLGIEAEVVLPFNNNKWSLLFEPTFQSFDAEGESSLYNYKVSCKFIELPLGLRYYSFIGEKSKLFFNAHFNPTMLVYSGDKVQRTVKSYLGSRDDFDMQVEFGSYALGVGFEIYRFTSEIRYYAEFDLASQYVSRLVTYERLSLIIGYKFIKLKK